MSTPDREITKGPWQAVESSRGWHVACPTHIISQLATNEGDARVMAAAPDLLSAAREVMEALEKYGASIVPHLIDTDMNAGKRLRDAIAKATGAQG